VSENAYRWSGSIDAEVKDLLDEVQAGNTVPMEDLAVDEMRRRSLVDARATCGEPVAVNQVRDIVIPCDHGDVRARMYTPKGTAPFPALLFVHGGGFITCSVDTHDADCRSLCDGAKCVVVSVDYRLAPEHPFPAAIDDVYRALEWVASNAKRLNIDASRIAIGGDSAGGNLSASACLIARDRSGPAIRCQMLIYPATNLAHPETSSYIRYGEGYLVTRRFAERCLDAYFDAEGDARNPYASPFLAADLSNLPPAFILTAEFDIVRDDGEAYAARLKDSGVPTHVSRYDGMIHGFFSMTGVLSRARVAQADAAAALRAAFSEDTSDWTASRSPKAGIGGS